MNLFGPCLKRLPPTPGEPRPLHLTFDDGPNDDCTAKTLDVLARHGAHATFFVIAREAAKRPALLRRIRAEGHTIGNHSLDHRHRVFFGGYKALLPWVRDGEAMLNDLLGEPTIGFRSPNGVRTPQLDRVLRELGLPLIHWHVRFYDASWPWTAKKALKSFVKTKPGSIVLLHDRQQPQYAALFLETLHTYLIAAHARQFKCLPITAEDAQAYFLEHGEARCWQT